MAQLRNALRAYAFDGAPPADVLGKLDALIRRSGEDAFATCSYATIAPASGLLRIASAGHLPAVVAQEGTVGPWWVEPGPPLGARDGTFGYTEAEMHLAPGGLVLVYTDGLVERRDESIDAGIERLRLTIERSAPSTAMGLGRALAAELVGSDAADDVCTLALRRSD
jgi:serine phosphatase RsbU (regulator of sigma subunit)